VIEHIQEAAFDAKVRNAALPVVVDFYGQGCPPCDKLAPIFEQVAGEFDGRASFVKIDVGDASSVAAEFGIFGVPTVLFFKEGRPVDKVMGLVPKNTLVKRVAELVEG
jgi:thioredoxin 1